MSFPDTLIQIACSHHEIGATLLLGAYGGAHTRRYRVTAVVNGEAFLVACDA
jgi:hypothetical protein